MGARTVSEIGRWLAPRSWRSNAALARPMTAAAIRIPDRMSAQLALVVPQASPRLFVHEGARQSLERKLKSAFPGRPVALAITDNRHSIISHTLQKGILVARIHHMFLDAPARVTTALVRYIASGDRDASLVVGHYIDANGGRLARRPPRAIPLAPEGSHHDLHSIFQEINQRYFGGSCTALVTWGRHVRRRRGVPRKAIKLGSYSHLERVIRIHPCLDRAWVPRYFVAFVVYHEMLHHVIPAARGTLRTVSANLASERRGPSSRRVLHPPEFVERERNFRRYERAIEWERRHIGRLLRSS